MKNLAFLTLILALAACGGGSGGDGAPVYVPGPIVNPGTQNDPQLLAQKAKTIAYVHKNLGTLMNTGTQNSAPSTASARAAIIARSGVAALTADQIEAEYQEVLPYIETMNRVMNAESNEDITNQDAKIAYSLSADKPYDEITEYDMPNINVSEEAKNVVIDSSTTISSVRASVTDKVESNIALKESVTQEIANSNPVLADIVNNDIQIDPNASLINPNLLDNLGDNVETGLAGMFRDFEFHFNDDGVIDGASADGSFTIDRVGTTSVFKTPAGGVWTYTFAFTDQGSINHEVEIDADHMIEDRTELANLAVQQINSNIPDSDKQAVRNRIINDPDYGEWKNMHFSGDMHSLGRVNGLKYSDFGYYTLDTYNFTFTYDGGMAGKKVVPTIDPSDTAETKIMFNGTAAGELQQNVKVGGVETVALADNNRPIITDTGAATLTFTVQDGLETLNMPFKNWYTVTVNKSGDKIKSINFVERNPGDVADQWKISTTSVDYSGAAAPDDMNDDGLLETRLSNSSAGHNYDMTTTMVTTYYGANETPTEATAFLNHIDENEYDGTYTYRPIDALGQVVLDANEDPVEVSYTGHIERQVWFDTVFGGTVPEQPQNP